VTADATNVFSTSTQVTGKVFAANYTPPTPSDLTTAVSDMQLAFTAARGRAPDVTELGAGNIRRHDPRRRRLQVGHRPAHPDRCHLTGSATDVWIFQIGQDLTMSSGARSTWRVEPCPRTSSGRSRAWWFSARRRTARSRPDPDVDHAAHGWSINGRLLAQTAVGIDGSSVVQPAQ